MKVNKGRSFHIPCLNREYRIGMFTLCGQDIPVGTVGSIIGKNYIGYSTCDKCWDRMEDFEINFKKWYLSGGKVGRR